MTPSRKSQNWLPGIFNDFFGNEWMQKNNSMSPAINIVETDNAYKLEVAAPGMTKEDFSVRIENDNELIISLEKKQEQKEEDKQGRYLRREFSFTQFRRVMILPDNIDKEKIEAKVENGVLNVNIPKKEHIEEEKATKKIEIK